MSTADILDDSWPHTHGTPDGYDNGCRSSACPAGAEYGLSCKTAKTLWRSDFRYARMHKAGDTVAAIADAFGFVGVDSTPPPTPQPTPADIRAWARDRGYTVAARGLIPASIVEHYWEAHGLLDPTPTRTPEPANEPPAAPAPPIDPPTADPTDRPDWGRINLEQDLVAAQTRIDVLASALASQQTALDHALGERDRARSLAARLGDELARSEEQRDHDRAIHADAVATNDDLRTALTAATTAVQTTERALDGGGVGVDGGGDEDAVADGQTEVTFKRGSRAGGPLLLTVETMLEAPWHVLIQPRAAVNHQTRDSESRLMYPITSYKITPDLFGRTRWMAEIDGQHSRFARRAYSQNAAERKISRDENHLFKPGGVTFMQGIFLPAAMPIRRWHDRLCHTVDQRRRARRARADVEIRAHERGE